MKKVEKFFWKLLLLLATVLILAFIVLSLLSSYASAQEDTNDWYSVKVF